MGEKRICDYFVVAGVPESPSRQPEDSFQPSLDPITDITVIVRSLYEPVPKGYTCIEKTPSGHSADLNHGSFRSPKIFLCYKRGRDKPPLLDIGVWYKDGKESLNQNCRVLKNTHSGFPANVNNSGTQTYLTYWPSSKKSHFNQLVVTDICVILTNKNENPPPAYCVIEKNLNKAMIGSDVFICYKKSMDRPPHLTYKPVIIDRYPLKNYPQYSLSDNLPLFCLPMGATIERWPKADASLSQPSLSTFVLTSSLAEKVYASLLNFYEPISPGQLSCEELRLLQYGENPDKSKQLYSVQRIKSICLLSHYPFFDQFKRFLHFIYNTYCASKEATRFSLEWYIFHFMKSIPFPSPERPNILVNIGLPQREETLLFSTSDDLPVPLNGASFRKMLLNLGSENCLYVLLFVLTEQKILLHSLRLSVLTELAEALVTMIFPFNWNCPYIPMCPLSLSGVLNAPLPFIVGIDSRYFDQFESPGDVVCIDIDTKAIVLTELKRHLNLNMLPRREMRVLKQTLDHIHDRLRFPNHQLAGDVEGKNKFLRQVEAEIQDAFLYFMASILKDFRQFLKPITAPKVGATDPTSLFDVEGFIASRDQNYHSFYELLTRTQMFAKFIEERSLVSDKNVSFAFFDECIEKVSHSEQDTGQCPKPTLIELDDRNHSNKTVFIALSDLLQCGEESFSYAELGSLDQRIFASLESKYLPATDPTEPYDSLQVFSESAHSANVELHSYRYARRAKHEVRKSLHVAQQACQSGLEWAKYLLITSYSLWFTHFPAFSHSLRQESQVKPLSIAYQVLQRMQRMKFSEPDEFCYRILMILCGVHSQPALAVKVFLDMQKHQVPLNAITYGYYNKAVLDGNWPSGGKHARWSKVVNILRVMLYFRHHIKRDTRPKARNEPLSIPTRPGVTLPSPDFLFSEEAGILMTSDSKSTRQVSLLLSSSVSLCSVGERRGRKRHKSSENNPNNTSTVSIDQLVRVNRTVPDSDRQPVQNGLSGAGRESGTQDTFSARFGTPLKEAVADMFSPKSRVALTLRSSLRIAKNLTKSSKYGFTRNPSTHNSDRNLYRASQSATREDEPKRPVPGLPRSSTLPQTFDSRESLSEKPKSVQERSPTLPSSVAWTPRLPGGKHSDYVYSTFKLAATRLNELKSSFSTASPSMTASPVKLNMANLMASISQFKTFNLDEEEVDSSINIDCGSDNPEMYQELFDTASAYYATDIEVGQSSAQVALAIEMVSCSICRHCKAILFDEQIMCRWYADDSNLNTQCVYCATPFVPSLTVSIRDHRGQSPPKPLDPLSVPYLSPLVLRKELESILHRDGYSCLTRSRFVDDHPIVYWNLVWYFARLNLPSHITGLLLSSSALQNEQSDAHPGSVSVHCLWDKDIFYESTPLHRQWLLLRNAQLSDPSDLSTRDLYRELIDLMGSGDLVKPLQYLLSERSKSKGDSSGGNTPYNSLYRELLFLSIIELPNRVTADTFDRQYRSAFECLASKDKEMIFEPDHAPPVAAIFCRNLFKRLSLLSDL